MAVSSTGCATDRSEIVPIGASLPENLQDEETELRDLTAKVQNDFEQRAVFFRDSALETYLQEIAAPLLQNIQAEAPADF
ncbi:MAG TPA: hypothetical protein VD913_00875, partial [bacterium]|nr:hypothetical protein [bacterium]